MRRAPSQLIAGVGWTGGEWARRQVSFAPIIVGLMLSAIAVASDLQPERLTSHEWRLFSEVFPTLPGEGYSIRLHPHGTVETVNLSLVARWALNGANELELQAQDGTTLRTFRWYPEKSLLVSCPPSARSPLPPTVLALPGSTIRSVIDGLRELGLYRCSNGAGSP
jgi:hypothetical protein